MTRKGAITAALTGILLWPALTGAEAVKVKAVEFRGLEHLSKYDLFQGVKSRSVSDGIIIDLDSLEEKLSRSRVIDRYSIRRSGGRLVITVRERVPAYTVLVRSGERTIPLELDRDFQQVSRGRLYFNIRPFIYVDRKDITDGGVSYRVKNLCRLLETARKNLPSLYVEIEELYLNGNRVTILLNNRKTEFTLKPEKKRFTMLAYMVGYLDRTKRYPESVLITGTRAVIR